MSASSFSSGYPFTHLGMDVHRDTISVGVLPPDRDSAVVEKISHDPASVRRLVGRFEPAQLRVCYEAGPTGYQLARLLTSMKVSCDVIAPSLIPTPRGDRVKTDARDCRRLAQLHRAGALVAIRVPTLAEEGVRDLCRARADLCEDRRRARQRLTALLLRYGIVWRGGATWTQRHQQWIAQQRLDDPAATATLRHYLATVTARDSDVAAIDAEVLTWFDHPQFHDRCAPLSAYRGIDQLGALVLVSEVCDWRRFDSARRFMGFCGLVPSEHSSGTRTRRGSITKAGNVAVRTQLVESAYAYQHPARLTRHIARRQEGLPPETIARAWTAQQRLHRRFKALQARKSSRNVVVTAIARELAGFIWAEMTA